MKSFSKLPLTKAMLNNLQELNYIEMTPIQEKSIMPILEGKDLLAQAKTGSGKTAAYGIGVMHKLEVKRFRIQAVVLCPTRELAEQVSGELRRIARFQHNIKLLKITGGMPLYKQEHSLSHEAHVVVGTPGRLLKLLERGSLSFKDVKTLVLDEADQMMDMGFIDQVKEIFSYAPIERQTLCFSATFSEVIKKLSHHILKDPQEISVDTKHNKKAIEHHFYKIEKQKRSDLILALLKKHKPESTLIFCNTKDSCRRVKSYLVKAGLHSLAIHGDLEQRERTEVLIRFVNKSSNILVATDVAARGLDISELGAVINYEMPFEKETYVHRVGRTGRAGKEGHAYSLVIKGEEFRFDQLSEMIDTNLDFEENPLLEDLNFDDYTPSMITLSINGGRKNKISAGDILGALTSPGGIKGEEVGKIDRLDFLTFVAVKRDVVSKAQEILERDGVKGRKFKVIRND